MTALKIEALIDFDGSMDEFAVVNRNPESLVSINPDRFPAPEIYSPDDLAEGIIEFFDELPELIRIDDPDHMLCLHIWLSMTGVHGFIHEIEVGVHGRFDARRFRIDWRDHVFAHNWHYNAENGSGTAVGRRLSAGLNSARISSACCETCVVA